MGFFAREKRICQDRPVKIASENVLYLAGNAQLCWSDDRELSPFASQVIAGPERPFIGAHAFWLHVSAKFPCLLAPVSLSLNDVVITLTPYYLSPKSQLPCVPLQCQSLNSHHSYA